MKNMVMQQYTKLRSILKNIKIPWFSQIAFFAAIVMFATIPILQKHTGSVVYSVFAANEAGIENLLQKISGQKNVISPESIKLPFSNFHEIRNETLSNIHGRLIEQDPRKSTLLAELIGFFYPKSEADRFFLRFIVTNSATRVALNKTLQESGLDYKTAPAERSSHTRIPGMLLLIAGFVSLLFVKKREVRKWAMILTIPWLMIQCFILSESFGLLLLIAEALLYGLLLYKPFNRVKQRFLWKHFLIYHLSLIVASLFLIIADPINLVWGIGASVLSWFLYYLGSKPRIRDHSAPVFSIIVPKQPFWMSKNKHLLLICTCFILISNLISGKSSNLVKFSDAEISRHYEQQLFTTQGSVNKDQTQKPVFKMQQGKIGILYNLDDLFSPKELMASTKIELDPFLDDVMSSSGINAYLIVSLVLSCLLFTIDVFVTAGKKIGIMLHSNSSKNIGRQDINISATDVMV